MAGFSLDLFILYPLKLSTMQQHCDMWTLLRDRAARGRLREGMCGHRPCHNDDIEMFRCGRVGIQHSKWPYSENRVWFSIYELTRVL